MVDDHTIKTIRDVVDEHLAPAKVIRVSAEEDVDHDGEPILRVEIVVELDGDTLDPEKVLSLPRHLRDPLTAISEEKFPLISFLSKEEFEGEAA